MQNKGKKNKKRTLEQSAEDSSGNKRKKQQESDEEPQEDASDTSSVTGGRDSVLPADFDARSECSNTTNNDDNSSTRSNSPLVLPIIDSLPAKFKRVGAGEENRSCARTDVVFVHPEKPKVKEISKHTESSTSTSSPTKTEVSTREYTWFGFATSTLLNRISSQPQNAHSSRRARLSLCAMYFRIFALENVVKLSTFVMK